MKLTSLLLALLLEATSGQIQLINPNQPPALPLITNAPTATAFNWPCSNTYTDSCTSTNQAGVQLARRPGTLWDGGGFWNFDRKNFGDCAEICTGACEAAVFFNPTSCYIVTSNYFYQDYWFSNTDADRQDITAVTVVNTDMAMEYGGVASMWPLTIDVPAVVSSSLVGGIVGGAVPGGLPSVAVSVATPASGVVSTGDATLPSIVPGPGSPSIVPSPSGGPPPAVPSPQAAAIESALSVLAASARTSVSTDTATPIAAVPSSVVPSASIPSLASLPTLQSALPSPQAAIQSALSVLAANARTSSDVGSSPSYGAPVSIPAFTASGDAIAWAMSIWAANARSSSVPTAIPTALGNAVSSVAGIPSLASSSRPAIPSYAATSVLLPSGIAASSSLRSYTSVTRVLTPVGPPARLVIPFGIIFPGITLTKPSLLPGEFYTTPSWVIIPPSPTAVVALPFGTSSALLPGVVLAGPAPTACPSANNAITSLNGRQFQITCNTAHCGATATYPGNGVAVTNIASCIGQCTGSCIGMYYTSGWCMEIVGGGSRCPNMPGYTAAYPYTPAAAVAASSVIPACGNGLLGLGLLCIL